MDPRGKYQLDLCGSPTATLSVRHEVVLDEVVLEKNPFNPRLEVQMQQEDAQRLARGMSRRIFTSHTELRAILERHEETIQKRWIKKTNAQRQAILLKVWPKSKYLLTLCPITSRSASPTFTGCLTACPKAVCWLQFVGKVTKWWQINQPALEQSS